MKTFNIFGFEIDIHLSIKRVSSIVIDIPDGAYDIGINWIDNDKDPSKIRYWLNTDKGLGPRYIDLPKSKDAKIINELNFGALPRTGRIALIKLYH